MDIHNFGGDVAGFLKNIIQICAASNFN